MKGKRRISMFVAAMMCVCILVGCGNRENKDPDGSVNSVPQTQKDSDVQENSQPESDEPDGWSYLADTLENPNVTIALYWEPNVNEQAAITAFEKKYGGKVTVNVVGWNKCATAIQEAMATGDLFDLCFLEGFQRFPEDAVNELYQPIDEYIDHSVCDQESLDLFLFKGKHYVYTNFATIEARAIFYNKTLFEEEALETPMELYEKGQWTYDKFLEYMAYFTRDTDHDGEIDQWGLGPRFKRQDFGLAIGATPVYEVGDGTLEVGLDSEECIHYFDFLNEFGKIDTNCPGDGHWLETRACAMFMEGMSYSIDRTLTTDEIDFVNFPTYDGSQAYNNVWDKGYAVVNGAPNPEGAAILATMICQAEKDGLDNKLTESFEFTPEQVERYHQFMEKIIMPRRKYAGVTVNVGEAEALEGTPAQTIIETYKSQLEAEVAAYNKALK